ncbi:histidyl-tRNA synthetase [Cucurbitaria berberidis CBS 394.84]|uniref:histidine--tRNA ligase n=1 Tax=Cucurbitaria berberidis CBS 394.84 TaxID=1168544 RepID=A0A9P4GTE9_9PLEO|nr:histidyl-tRNA synthetase [Cucurbitaria berberidis CBS 394.84]KAF1851161.1 histidyl-tRNA synthetase [Cucurbitaria berberidis CBS 394.84]
MSPMQMKTPKGTRDWAGEDITLREHVFDKIRSIFRLHGGAELDTPVFELKSILTDKYGEDAKLIYDLQDQGGELCALRYDLTVPFARWLAMSNVRQIKRYQIGKVYRRDQPAIARGRLREFYQCDFDYAGTFDLMVPDSEVLSVIVEVFEALRINVTIKLNHRCILDGMFAAVGVPQDQLRSISSAVDKLDKSPWEEVKKEMLQKGLAAEVVDKLGSYLLSSDISNASDIESTLSFIKSDEVLMANEDVKKGVQEMELLSQYLSAYDIATYVKFDLSLARGLDYYTGLIYEVIPESFSTVNGAALQVGSIAAGGRYDTLVGMFSRRDIPCVGISFGVDRILTILNARQNRVEDPKPKIDTWIIASDSSSLVEERMAIARELRQAYISVDFNPNASQKPRKQLEAADCVVVAVYLEEDTETAGGIRVKVLTLPEKNLDKATVVDREDLVDEVRKRLV